MHSVVRQKYYNTEILKTFIRNNNKFEGKSFINTYLRGYVRRYLNVFNIRSLLSFVRASKSFYKQVISGKQVSVTFVHA